MTDATTEQLEAQRKTDRVDLKALVALPRPKTQFVLIKASSVGEANKALIKRCSLIVGSKLRSGTTHQNGIRMVCERAGRSKERSPGEVVRASHSRRDECTFSLNWTRIGHENGAYVYALGKCALEHSSMYCSEAEGLLPVQSKWDAITLPQDVIDVLHQAGLGPARIGEEVSRRTGTHITAQEMRNLLARLGMVQPGDPCQASELAAVLVKESALPGGPVWDFVYSPDGVLTTAMWAFPDLLKGWPVSNGCILADATHRKNNLGWPLWAMWYLDCYARPVPVGFAVSRGRRSPPGRQPPSVCVITAVRLYSWAVCAGGPLRSGMPLPQGQQAVANPAPRPGAKTRPSARPATLTSPLTIPIGPFTCTNTLLDSAHGQLSQRGRPIGRGVAPGPDGGRHRH